MGTWGPSGSSAAAWPLPGCLKRPELTRQISTQNCFSGCLVEPRALWLFTGQALVGGCVVFSSTLLCVLLVFMHLPGEHLAQTQAWWPWSLYKNLKHEQGAGEVWNRADFWPLADRGGVYHPADGEEPAHACGGAAEAEAGPEAGAVGPAGAGPRPVCQTGHSSVQHRHRERAQPGGPGPLPVPRGLPQQPEGEPGG